MNFEEFKNVEEKIFNIVQRLVEGSDFVLVDVSIKGLGGRKRVEIAIDKEGGITLSECEKISNEISLLLDAEDVIRGPYILEVGSPGLDRILRTDRELSWARGKKVIIYTGEKQYSGILKGFDEKHIYIDSGEILPRVEIKKIKLNEV